MILCSCDKQKIDGDIKIVGHVPRRISALCSVFIRRGGTIRCIVNGNRYSYKNTFGIKKVRPSKVESYLGVNT